MNVAYNMDCMEYMQTLQDKAFDLAVVDPPYFSGPERRGYYCCKVSKIGVHRDYPYRRSGIFRHVNISMSWNVSQSAISFGVATISTITLRRGALFGTSATRAALLAIARSQPQTAMTAYGFSTTCGME